jgi:hypothetical protein
MTGTKWNIVYITNNELKFKVALQALQNSPVVLERKSLKTPEIQSKSVEEIAIKAGRRNGTSIDQIFIAEGYARPISELSSEEILAYWSNAKIWQELKLHMESL